MSRCHLEHSSRSVNIAGEFRRPSPNGSARAFLWLSWRFLAAIGRSQIALRTASEVYITTPVVEEAQQGPQLLPGEALLRARWSANRADAEPGHRCGKANSREGEAQGFGEGRSQVDQDQATRFLWAQQRRRTGRGQEDRLCQALSFG